MTAKSGSKDDEKVAPKEEKVPLTKKATFVASPSVIEEEPDSDVLERVVSTMPVTIVPSMSRMSTNASLLSKKESKK